LINNTLISASLQFDTLAWILYTRFEHEKIIHGIIIIRNTIIRNTKIIFSFKIINETRISFGWFDLIWSLVFNATFSNISAISWRPVLVMERTTDHGQATGKLYHLRLLVECTLFVIYKAGRELMDNTPQMKTF
jgi:hypothetical protein